MTSREFIAAEAGNTDRITLYREGLFWKAYERSAFAVCAQVRGFKPTKKALKSLGGEVLISIGFPTRHEAAVLDGLQRLTEEENRLVLQTPRPIVGREFEAWKASIPVAHDRRPTKEGGARRSALRAAQRAKNPKLRFDDPYDPCDSYGERLQSRGAAGNPAAPGHAGAIPTGGGRVPMAHAAGMRETSAPGHAGVQSEGAGLRPERRQADVPGARSAAAMACNDSPAQQDYRAEGPIRGGEADFSLAEACRVAEAIRGFNLAEKTPMECMLFISELKKTLINR